MNLICPVIGRTGPDGNGTWETEYSRAKEQK